jgi:hypothetical protein
MVSFNQSFSPTGLGCRTEPLYVMVYVAIGESEALAGFTHLRVCYIFSSVRAMISDCCDGDRSTKYAE